MPVLGGMLINFGVADIGHVVVGDAKLFVTALGALAQAHSKSNRNDAEDIANDEVQHVCTRQSAAMKSERFSERR